MRSLKINFKKYGRFLALGMAMAMLFAFSGCSAKESSQLDPPSDGEKIATISIKDFGEVKVKFFEKAAPKAVENFITHSENGYYDGLTFHRVVDQFMIQGGDPEGSGMGGESIWGKGFGLETSEDVRHYTGALAMAHSSLPDSNGSQFYIVNSDPFDENNPASERSLMGVTDEKVLENYKKLGGAPSLDGGYTVFGQVFEGLDNIKKIMQVEVNGETPTALIVIESIKISTYKAS